MSELVHIFFDRDGRSRHFRMLCGLVTRDKSAWVGGPIHQMSPLPAIDIERVTCAVCSREWKNRIAARLLAREA